MKVPINTIITFYLQQQKREGKEWVFKNWIQSYVYERSDNHHNWDTTSRELRRMCEMGEIVKDKKEIGGKKVLVYKQNETKEAQEAQEVKDPIPTQIIGLEKLFAPHQEEGRGQERGLPLYNVLCEETDDRNASGTRNWGQTQLFAV